MYESLSPLQGQEDTGATKENKTGGKDATAEKPLRKGAADTAMVGILLAAQVAPKTAPPLAARLGVTFPASSAAQAGTRQEEAAVLASTENHPDMSSASSSSSVYLSGDAQSKQKASSVMSQAEATSRSGQWQAAPAPRFNASSSDAIPSALPALATDPTDSLRGNGPHDSVGSQQVTAPVQTRELGLSSQGAAGALIVPTSEAISTSNTPVGNANRPGTGTSRAAALRVSNSPASPTAGAPAPDPKVERDATAQPATVAPQHTWMPQDGKSNNAEVPLSVPPLNGAAVQPEGPVDATAAAQEKNSEPSAGTPNGDIGNALLAQSLSKVPFVARSENLAFALNLQASKSGAARPQAASQQPAQRNPALNNVKNEPGDTAAAGPPIPARESHETSAMDFTQKAVSSQMRLPGNDTPVLMHTDLRPISTTSELGESGPVNPPLATHDLQLVPPEAPKTGVSPEIQFHLTGNDQSSASIRVTDRAGAVNISVHASDPQLRNSLRSNLSELSGQLNDQGWKTEVKSAAVMPHAEGGQDTSSNGKNFSNQQKQFTQGEPQPQRQRRPNQEQWQEELEHQISGNEATGGNK